MIADMKSNEDFVRQLRVFNPLEWLDEKSAFDEGKKQKYFKTLMKQMQSDNPAFIGSFKTMVKSGEVQYSESFLNN